MFKALSTTSRSNETSYATPAKVAPAHRAPLIGKDGERQQEESESTSEQGEETARPKLHAPIVEPFFGRRNAPAPALAAGAPSAGAPLTFVPANGNAASAIARYGESAPPEVDYRIQPVLRRRPASFAGTGGATDGPGSDHPEPPSVGDPRSEMARINRSVAFASAGPAAGTPSPLPSEAEPLESSLRASLEARFQSDFTGVRIHAGAGAAALALSQHAKAYTQGNNIVFGAGQFAPSAPAGRLLLAHELAHVVQQSRPGGPQPGPAHEREAEASAVLAQGTGNVSIALPSASAAIQRAPESLDNPLLKLNDSSKPKSPPDLNADDLGIIDQIDQIQEWVARQTKSSPESARHEQDLQQLLNEVARRKKAGKWAPVRTPKPNARAAAPDPGMQKPRTLYESVSYRDSAEMKREMDLIKAWLGRNDVKKTDRRMLRAELARLTQLYRGQRSAERRSAQLQKAVYEPSADLEARRTEILGGASAVELVGGGPSAELVYEHAKTIELVRRIDSIYRRRDGLRVLMRNGEMFLLEEWQFVKLRASVRQTLDDAAKKVRDMNDDTMFKANAHLDLNYDKADSEGVRKETRVAVAVRWAGGQDAGELFDRVLAVVARSNQASLQNQGKPDPDRPLEGRAESVLVAIEQADRARRIVERGIASSMSAAGSVVGGLTIVRNLSFTIAVSLATAGALAPVAGAVGSAAGAVGLTGVAATGTTIVGTGVILTAGGGVMGATLRVGSSVLGQLEATGTVNAGETWNETKSGFKQGSVDALTTAATGGLAKWLGPSASFVGKTAKGAVAGGGGSFAGGTLSGLEEGKGLDASLGQGFAAAPGGFVGGGVTSATGSFFGESTTGRVLAGTFGGVAGGGTGALIEGGSAKEGMLLSGLAGGISSLASPHEQGPSAESDTPLHTGEPAFASPASGVPAGIGVNEPPVSGGAPAASSAPDTPATDTPPQPVASEPTPAAPKPKHAENTAAAAAPDTPATDTPPQPAVSEPTPAAPKPKRAEDTAAAAALDTPATDTPPQPAVSESTPPASKPKLAENTAAGAASDMPATDTTPQPVASEPTPAASEPKRAPTEFPEARPLEHGAKLRRGADGRRWICINPCAELEHLSLEDDVIAAAVRNLPANQIIGLVETLGSFRGPADIPVVEELMQDLSRGGEEAASATNLLERVHELRQIEGMRFQLPDLVAAYRRGDAVLAHGHPQVPVFVEDMVWQGRPVGRVEIHGGRLTFPDRPDLAGVGLPTSLRKLDFVILEGEGGTSRLVLGKGHYELSGHSPWVFGAGELRVSRYGEIISINRLSGHYQPAPGNPARVRQFLRERGILGPRAVDALDEVPR